LKRRTIGKPKLRRQASQLASSLIFGLWGFRAATERERYGEYLSPQQDGEIGLTEQ
jgi:hypothetical protein